MLTDRTKQINWAMVMLVSVVAIIALSVSMAGTFCEAHCNDDCQEESGSRCTCICCPNNIVMTQSDDNSNQLEFATCQWILACPDLLGEQEWFTNIDYPPRNLT